MTDKYQDNYECCGNLMCNSTMGKYDAVPQQLDLFADQTTILAEDETEALAVALILKLKEEARAMRRKANELEGIATELADSLNATYDDN